MVGTVRDTDFLRIAALREAINSMGLQDRVLILENLTREQLTQQLGNALIGLHTMRDEHFGIGVVELMASGVITIAHRSAGPLLDIVVPSEGENRVGYLAETAQEYADAILQVVWSDH